MLDDGVYNSEFGELDSGELASPEIESIPPPVDDEAITMKVTISAS